MYPKKQSNYNFHALRHPYVKTKTQNKLCSLNIILFYATINPHHIPNLSMKLPTNSL